jgi:flavin-binding protein dodecin
MAGLHHRIRPSGSGIIDAHGVLLSEKGPKKTKRRGLMSVYKLIEIIGTSSQSWEDAALSAVKTARRTLRDLRVAEVIAQDMDIAEGDDVTFRTKLRVSFRFEGE